jgi:flagellar assembly protein FliH
VTQPRSRIISDGAERTVEHWTLPAVSGPVTHDQNDEEVPRLPTAEEIAAIHQQAYDEGFNMGRREGRSAAYKETREKWNERTQQLRLIIDQLAEPLKTLDEEVESSLIDLVTLIGKHLVRRELKTHRGEIVAVVRDAMSRLPLAARNPRLHMHPEDTEIVRSALGLDNEQKAWQLVPDPLVTRGGCLVETDSSYIDATVEARLSATIARMLGGEREGD